MFLMYLSVYPHPPTSPLLNPKDLSATRTNRYARNSRREARCRRLPAAFRRLARDFRLLRGFAPGAGSTTLEPLRAASCLCLFLAIAADALLSQGKSVFVGSREKGACVCACLALVGAVVVVVVVAICCSTKGWGMFVLEMDARDRGSTQRTDKLPVPQALHGRPKFA